jgi:nucleoside-diphosphate-sugar epimerase
LDNNFGKILITGGTGFVGKSLQNFFLERNINYSLALRNTDSVFNKNTEIHGIGDINLETDWSEALEEVDMEQYLSLKKQQKKELKDLFF